MKPPPITEPFDFEEARAFLEGKLDKPTAMKSVQIAQVWSDEAKRRAFFSARVASADLLSELHRRCNAVVAGEMTDTQARELLRVFLSGDGKYMLASLGFSPPSADGGLSELGSVRRLQLVIGQNTKMAQEVGAYRQWRDNAAFAPYGRWRLGISEHHRAQHVAHNGKVFRFDHPIWTTDPPGGLFNCHCWREELTAQEVKALGLSPQPQDSPLEPSPLGFDPSRGLAEPVPVKPGTPPAIADALREEIGSSDHLLGFVRKPAQGPPISGGVVAPGTYGPVTIKDPMPSAVSSGIQAVSDAVPVSLPKQTISLMAEDYSKAHPSAHGSCRITRAGLDIRINPHSPIPGITTIHENIHGLFRTGLVDSAAADRVFEAVMKTGTYAEGAKSVRSLYSSVGLSGSALDSTMREEWVARAATWWVAKNSPEISLRAEKFELFSKGSYNAWWKDDAESANLGREVAAMLGTRKNLMRRIKEVLGLSDTHHTADPEFDRMCREFLEKEGITWEEHLRRNAKWCEEHPDQVAVM